MLAKRLDDPNLLREPPQLLKVDETFDLSLVPLVQEGEVLLDDGEEGDEGRVSGPLEFTILGHVVKRVHKA